MRLRQGTSSRWFWLADLPLRAISQFESSAGADVARLPLRAFEPVPGHYRIELIEYERWLHRPARRASAPPRPTPTRERVRATGDPSEPGSFARLRAIELT
jgi:hypothetical protein